MKRIKTVLLIDDDEATNFIHKKIVQTSGLVDVVYVARGGEEALLFLGNDNNEKEKIIPDLIFLDINMPAMDGWEFLVQYEKLKHLKKENIVVVMLTTSLNPDDEVKAKGIKEIYGYRNKPLTRTMLEEIVTKI